MNRLTKEQLEYMNGYMPANIHDIFATGGGIHIDPSHEGMFTAYKERTGKTTEEALHSPDPHVRQMANFAKNASHWKHEEGGTATGQQKQMTQIVQAYAQVLAQEQKQDPNEVYKQIMQHLQGLKPNELKNAINEMTTELQKNTQSQQQGAVMQQGGPAPQEVPVESQSQQQDPQQLIPAVQQALKQGAKPEEIIAGLLQNQIDPKMIVQILVQLGMPQEQVIQEVQSVMQQGAPQEQEQENPQEQVQEQGQEEQPMEYGGTPQYPYGGAMSSNKYFRADPNVLPNNKFNNTLVNGNMLGSPYFSPIGTLSSIDAAPAQGLAMGLGAISSILGSAAGYSALTSKIFGKKNHAQGYQNYFQAKDNQVQNAKMPNFNGNPPASTPRANESIYPNKQNDIWNQFQKQKDPYANWKPGMQTPDVPVAPMAPISQVGPQDMYNPAAPTSGASMNKLNGAPVMTMQKYGGLPHAQYGEQVVKPLNMTTTPVNVQTLSPQQQALQIAAQKRAEAIAQREAIRQQAAFDLAARRSNRVDINAENKIKEQAAINEMLRQSHDPNLTEEKIREMQAKNQEKAARGAYDIMTGKTQNEIYKVSGEGRMKSPCQGGKCPGQNKYGGELPHAQFGFNFSDPYGLNNNAFGQTANYADTQGYASSKAAAARLAPAGNTYNRPGVVDGMGMGQEGYDYAYSTTQLPIMGPQDVYDPNKPISGASTNRLNGNTPAIKIQAGSFPSYASTINPNSINANNKTIKNSNPYRVSGDQIAMNSIIGANAFNFGLGWFDEKKQRNANFNHLAEALSSNDISFVNNPREVHGNYTPNVQGGAPSLQVDKYTTPQDYGTGWSKYGGQQNFQSGGQYKVSHEELLQLLRDGAEIDFL